MTAPTAQQAGAEQDLLRTIAAGTANVVGKAFFRSLVRHVAVALDADLAFAAELLDPEAGRAAILASWAGGEMLLSEGGEFLLEGSPCELLRDLDVVALPEGACGAYPTDPLIAEHALDSYLAILMRGSDGSPLGYIGVMSRRRLEASEEEVATLRIFGRAPPPRSSAGATRSRCASGRPRWQPRAHAWCTRPTTSAAASSATSTTAPSSGCSPSRTCSSLAQRKLERAPEDAATLLSQAHGEAQAAFSEVQELARGLHPAGLTTQGLRPPIERLAATLPVPLEIEALPERRLPEVLEVTVYYFVAEAATNAAKHARASAVRASVALRGRTLDLEVSDDGVGGATADGGSGLRGLLDRVEALGGSFELDSPPGGGTRVGASIPLAPWRDAREPFLEFGHDGDEGGGEQLIRLVLEGKKTAAISLAREWDLEGGAPRIGQQLPVMDHEDRRWATVEIVRIAVVPFGQIDSEVVVPETAGISSSRTGVPTSAASTTAAATRPQCCWASRAGALPTRSRW